MRHLGVFGKPIMGDMTGGDSSKAAGAVNDAPERILTPDQMRALEARAFRNGVKSIDLMEAAGAGACDAILREYGEGGGRLAVIACGPGNNGGDGYVVARRLRKAGWRASVITLVDQDGLKGDALENAKRFEGELLSASDPEVLARFKDASLIVDALFGIGLSRPLDEDAKALIASMNAAPARVVAIDCPSGVDGHSGAILGDAVKADLTLCFAAVKTGLLRPAARAQTGRLEVIDIGVDPAHAEGPSLFRNSPSLWRGALPVDGADTHKYKKGGVAVLSGPALATGAARLSAMAALRAGAGAVTLLADQLAAAEIAAHVTSLMVRVVATPEDVGSFLKDRRYRAIVLGPGLGQAAKEAHRLIAAIAAINEDDAQDGKGRSRSLVLDADGLRAFAEEPAALFETLCESDALTPHEGEFKALFPDLATPQTARIDAALEAAERAGCVLVLKGPDTVIAAPDGRAAVNTHTSRFLATAGSGDVLAGFIAAFATQGMPAFEAACAGVWVHGAAGISLGRGLIAEDLPRAARAVLADLYGD
ncbi:MAG: NAD(P)H-hydrate dehydratase [Pseudomonadota bacterium]